MQMCLLKSNASTSSLLTEYTHIFTLPNVFYYKNKYIFHLHSTQQDLEI